MEISPTRKLPIANFKEMNRLYLIAKPMLRHCSEEMRKKLAPLFQNKNMINAQSAVTILIQLKKNNYQFITKSKVQD